MKRCEDCVDFDLCNPERRKPCEMHTTWRENYYALYEKYNKLKDYTRSIGGHIRD